MQTVCCWFSFRFALHWTFFVFLSLNERKHIMNAQRSTAPKQKRNNSLPIEAVISTNTTTEPKNRAGVLLNSSINTATQSIPFQVGVSFNRFELIVFTIRDNQCKCYANIYTRPTDIWASEKPRVEKNSTNMKSQTR